LSAAPYARAQSQAPSLPTSTPAAAAPAAPEPIYWRQNLFLIPYQWTSTTDPNSANAVWLYVSKDLGRNWQKISEAQPQVRAFNYHAEADGQYWFAIRTIDKQGRSWPEGPMQAELKVVVDTTIPRFGDLSGTLADSSTLSIHWQVSDANLDAASCKIEIQADGAGSWQAISPPNPAPAADGIYEGKTAWHVPAGCRMAALRAVVYDRAGNQAAYQTSINLNGANTTAAAVPAPPPSPQSKRSLEWPTLISGRGDAPAASTPSSPKVAAPRAPVSLPSTDTASGWVSMSSPATASQPEPQSSVPQPWPSTNKSSSRPLANPSADKPAIGASQNTAQATTHFAAFGTASPNTEPADEPASSIPAAAESHSQFRPLEPFRESSATPPGARSAAPYPTTNIPFSAPISAGSPPASAQSSANPSPLWTKGIAPKWVNSRTFALEYELENISQRGVARVELWGTRDNGQTWRSFAVDDDNRSPIQVTVDEEGLYGFRIVVEAAGMPGGLTPRTGDRPDLWVGVDLHRPHVEFTATESGKGDFAGRILLRWQANDDHLDPRPIGLFYSSRPAGPWSTIATNLENTGQYDWQVERYVPSRVYLRVEARDLAGNVAAYQTPEAITVEWPLPAGRPSGVTPLGPTASQKAGEIR
jgi:hypothetical protein